jgi:hypothetical protein
MFAPFLASKEDVDVRRCGGRMAVGLLLLNPAGRSAFKIVERFDKSTTFVLRKSNGITNVRRRPQVFVIKDIANSGDRFLRMEG